MPGRIFGIDLRRPTPSSPQLEPAHLVVKNGGNNNTYFNLTDPRRANMDHFRRPQGLTLGKRHSSADKQDRSSSKDKNAPSRASNATRPIRLDMLMESPPALFLDPPQQSTGVLISGRLKVSPNDSNVVVNSIVMYLEATTTLKRPVQDRCRECAHVVNDLYEWNFLTKPKAFPLAQGTQELPFSHLIPGHLPATTHGSLASIEYSLHVRAKSSDGTETEFRRELIINRALRPGNDKNSVRVFPPTELTLHVTVPSMIHPVGDFPIQCRMTGIITKREETQTRWRLRRLSWRIEEIEEMVSPPCSNHAAKVGGPGKGVKHEHTRDVGKEDLKRGWKTDMDTGEIEGEFLASMNISAGPQCDVDSQNGLKISHVLVLEMVISEEWAPNKKPQSLTPTGAARVLRTQFNLNVTSRSGLGISWDDEMPPMYEDVPASPPHYQAGETSMVDSHGEELRGTIEHLSLDQVQ